MELDPTFDSVCRKNFSARKPAAASAQLMGPWRTVNAASPAGLRDCRMCLEACPEGAIRRIELADGGFEYVADDPYCIGCSICAGSWSMITVD
ncbi:MAG: hypothetical protein K0A93_12245 [Desulfuromonadaceae bacterium]|nr:hypothetical protein [Desulfuromonadaceae bacterium]